MSDVSNRVVGPQDRSANAAGAQSINMGGYQTTNKVDQSTDNSVDMDVRGDVGDVSGTDNVILGAGATQTTTYIESLDGDVATAAFAFGSGALDANVAANARALDFGDRALDSADDAYAGGFGFGKEALEIVASFGGSTIQNANARADSALAAVERLAAVPTERNSSPESRTTLLVLGGLAALALLFGGLSRRAKA